MQVEEFPTTPEAITSQWLTQILRAAGKLAYGQVIAFESAKMPNANGQLLRLTLHYDVPQDVGKTVGEVGPPTVIAKFPTADARTRAVWQQAGFYQNEVYFYQELANTSPLRVPQSYFAAIDVPAGNSLLLIEDLGTGHAINAKCTLEEATLAITEIAKLHAHWWRHPRLAEFVFPALDAHYYEGLQQNYAHGVEQKIASNFKDHLPDRLLALAPILFERLPTLGHLGSAPQTIIHYDYHAANMLFNAGGGAVPFAVIDWEFTLRGRGPHDVARFMGMNVAAEMRQAEEVSFLRLYYAALLAHGVGNYSYEECVYDYRMAALDCLARAFAAVAVLTPSPGRLQKLLDIGTLALDLRAGELL